MNAPLPFNVPEHADEAAWIKARVAAWRPFEEPENAGWAYGANHAYMQRLRTYWLEQYDWPAQVALLNARPHYQVLVDGLNVHFVHIRSPRNDAIPLLIAHGWPSTVYEFWKIFDPLTNPDDPSKPAFHIVAPSLPGYGWSGKPKKPVGPRAIAKLYATLMHDILGYSDYIAQGGDWGSLITPWIGLDAKSVRAIHLNGFGLRCADMTPLTPEQKNWVKRAQAVRQRETAYLHLQATKPQSLGFAMMDSPMGVAAWMCEKFCAWSDGIKGVGDPPFSFDDILTEIMIFLTTRTFATASWLYRGFFEEAQPCVPAGMRLTLPVGVANFPHDLLNFPPREMVERSYNVQHWRDMPRGGHFAAWEEPELFIEELQTFVSLLTN